MKPVAYRQWSTKFHCWEFEEARGDLRPDTEVDVLVLQSDAQALLEALQEIDQRLRTCMEAPGMSTITVADAYDSFYQDIVATAIAKATGQQPDPTR